MTTNTPNLSLVLYDNGADASLTFNAFRTDIAGSAVTSNFYKIDTAVGTNTTNIGTHTSQIASLMNGKTAVLVSAIRSSPGVYAKTGLTEVVSYVTGMSIILKLDITSTGATTLNINSLGAKSVMKVNTAGTHVDITGGELVAGKYYLFMYDGTRFVWVGATVADQLYIAGTAGNIVTVNSDNTLLGTSNWGSTKLSEGTMLNGRILPTVASNNLTISIKTFAGTDPSSTDPVYVTIGGVVRTITSALSVTVNAGANSFNAGGAELATKSIDYFSYLSWRTASSSVVIGYGRIPYANLYSDFSGTATNEKYGAFSTAPASTDTVVNIGRFEATLSAGVGYTWSVPTYTSINLIQRPIFNTRVLSWIPQLSASGSMTWTSTVIDIAEYSITNRVSQIEFISHGTTGGTASNRLQATMMFGARNYAAFVPFPCLVADGGSLAGAAFFDNTVSNLVKAGRYDNANYGLGVGRYMELSGSYFI